MANDDVPVGGAQEPGASEGSIEHRIEAEDEDASEGAVEDPIGAEVQVQDRVGDARAARARPSVEVAVRGRAETAALWRSRAGALRYTLPQLARNPVVVGASAAVAPRA